MKYRKKPVIIEAFKWNGISHDDKNYPYWINEAFNNFVLLIDAHSKKLYVSTLEGRMYVNVGDYIIKGIEGELYACKPDIFEKTYELVGENNEQK